MSGKRGVQAARNGPSEDRKCWQRIKLAIHGLNRWAVDCLEMSGKCGVQTDKTPRARTGSVGSALKGIEARRHAWPSRRLPEAQGATHFLAPGKRGWPPMSTWPLFSRTMPPAPRQTPHASRPTPDQRGEVVRRPFHTGYCLTPTADLVKTEWGPISTNDSSIFGMSPNQATPAEKPIRFSPLAAAQPLNILSRPETLNASGSRRACQMAISRNACSLPDFPEFAPGSREVLLLPRPLRTGRESFPSSSSSLHERPLRGAVASVRLSCTWICR